jgi:hypothetical protein
MLGRKGDWVLIEQIFLSADQRQSNIPSDTQATDFRLRIKGFLVNESSSVKEQCTIITKTQREITGELIELLPHYDHSFGEYLPETAYIEQQLKELLSKVSDE